MIDWKKALGEGLVSGTLAGFFSAAVLLMTGKRETGSAAAPVNAESHWLWGDESLREDRPTLRHTLTGIVTHQLSTVFWATLYALVRGERKAVKTVPEALIGGIATSAVAAAIDYTLVPKRLTPGFEHRLSRGSMAGVFAAIAGGIALGTLLVRSRRAASG
jgi:drug/metabolite transporter (DMT)-like permease